MTVKNTPKKIAILGGGMAGLSAAYWLSGQPDWQEKYDITIYQMGWRLGGKAANGRNQAHSDRDEEHGYHMLFGFYENAFATMRGCYAELNRGENQPLSEFIARLPEDEQRYPHRYAMQRNSQLFLPQLFNGEYKVMGFTIPTNGFLPGDGHDFDILVILENLLGWLWQVDSELHHTPGADPVVLSNNHPWLTELEQIIPDITARRSNPADPTTSPEDRAALFLTHQVFGTARMEGHLHTDKAAGIFDWVVRIIRWHMNNMWEKVKDKVNTDWDSYRIWILEDFVATTICGFLQDNLLTNGFDSINDQNFYEWFMKHGTVSDGTQVTAQSILMQFGYTACFAYEDGDATSPVTPKKPIQGAANIEAGTMLRGGMRLFMTYHGALDWIFQAGAGDILAAPMYEVLMRRGVKIELFQKVKKLVVPTDSKSIQAIQMERQVTLNVGQYQPLIYIKGLPCWPSEPLYPQIVEGQELQDRHVDLESFWTDWHGTDYQLNAGTDFDDVILAIPVGALPTICQDLIAQSSAWANMVNCVKTVRTTDIQTWLNQDLTQLGWTRGRTIGLTGVEPQERIADATEIVDFENWPVVAPRNLTLFGRPMPDDPNQPTPPDPAYPPTQHQIAQQIAPAYLNKYAGIF